MTETQIAIVVICTMHYVKQREEEEEEERLDGVIMSYFTRLQDCFHVSATSVVCICNVLQGIATYVAIAWLGSYISNPVCVD